LDEKDRKYLVIETAASGLVNGALNFAAAYLIFHGSARIPTTGPGSMLRDSIGETFIVTVLSVLIPSLVTRHRQRVGSLPVSASMHPSPTSRLYVRAIVTGLVFTSVFVPSNALVLPMMFPNGVSFSNILLFKTLYGAVLGSLATWLAIHKILNRRSNV
jgi:hypothetical protein